MKAVTILLICLVAGAGVCCHAHENQQITPARRLLGANIWKMTTVWDIIKGSKDHKTLAALIEANGLVAALDKPGLTVFAPTDAAFTTLLAALPKDVITNGGLVKTILFHHVVPAVLLGTAGGFSYTTLNPGNPIKAIGASQQGLCSFQDGQGNTVTSPTRIFAKVAAVYVTNSVLLPNNAFPSIEAAVKFYSAQLSTLTDLVVKANLVSALNAVQPQKTVFAPINKGFEAISSTVAKLSSEQVTQVLTYHVSGDGTFTVDFKPQTISTLLKPQTLSLVAPKFVKDSTDVAAEVLVANIWYPGGVIQAVNKVLLPKL